MIEEIKKNRVQLDGITTFIMAIPKSRELALAITAAQLSKMWLGKVLKELGNANPYPESKNPENEKIEPTADKAQFRPEVEADWVDFPTAWWQEATNIQKIKWLRAELEKIEVKLNWTKEYKDGYSEWKKDEDIILAMRDSKKHCIESAMWLGMELGRIRDAANSPMGKAIGLEAE